MALGEGSILDLGGGFRIEGPDAGEVIDISVGMDVVAIQWERARLRGWYDVETLSRLVSVDPPQGAEVAPVPGRDAALCLNSGLARAVGV